MKSIVKYIVNINMLLIQFIPRSILNLVSTILGYFFFFIVPIRKNIVLNNLAIAFPDFSKKEINKIALANYVSLTKTFLEIVKLKKTSSEWFIENVEVVNNELVEIYLQKKESLILLTAHFGNWEFGALTLGIKYNFSMNVLAKKQSNEFVTRFMSEAREKFGNKEIFTGSSVKELYKALLKKQIIGVVGDQRGPLEGPRVKFFNRDTAVYTGTAVLSLKTKTPILSVFVARQKNNKYKIFIDELSFENLPQDQEEKVIEINRRYFNKLENMIKQYPEQWFWMHKIWKY